jgi:hypothetical protein
MRRAANTLVIVLLVAIVGALILVCVMKVREAANRSACMNNLRQLGLAMANYEGTFKGCYPLAAMPNTNLPPEKRLSWLVVLMPFIEADPTYYRMEKEKCWDAEENRFAALSAFKVFQCPGYPSGSPVSTLWPTHYLGIAGVGEDAASLPAGDARAGFFGYERTLCKQELPRGESQTAMIAETSAAQGAWTAAGAPTVRGFDPIRARFGGNHPHGCQVVFADASLRFIEATVGDDEWAAIAVLAGKRSRHGDPQE